MYNLMQFILLALAFGLSRAMPYSVDFPSISIAVRPTLSPTTFNNTILPSVSYLNTTTSMTLTIHSTLSPSATSINNNTNSSLGACGPGFGSCPSGLCCSGYGYCGSNSSYCGTNCMHGFGVCGLNASHPIYSFSYAPLSTSASLGTGIGAAGIVTEDLGQTASSTSLFNYAPESSGGATRSTVASETKILFQPISTTFTAAQSTWAGESYTDSSKATVTMVKSVGC